jgi:hypothetical protein
VSADLQQPYALPIPSPDGGPRYRVTADWPYVWEYAGREFRLVVPAGFELDGTSIPRFLWTLTGITPDGLERAASTAHDYLYRYSGRVPLGRHQEHVRGRWLTCDYPWTRQEADALFARILRECGVGKLRRRLMYHGVRLFGWRSWEKGTV